MLSIRERFVLSVEFKLVGEDPDQSQTQMARLLSSRVLLIPRRSQLIAHKVV